MISWIVFPYEGANELRFGMTRTEVQDTLSATPIEFIKSSNSTSTTDAYSEAGLHVYYDDLGKVEFLEFYPLGKIFIFSIDIFNTDLNKFLEIMEEKGYKHRYNSGSWMFDDLGLALYAPSNNIEGVSLFKKGYYDEA